ncbi:hypothetical protein [Paenibacillus silvisoli]|uniref:hypothetical protein n=1 Tax=Paenibacillus silvisoli TaxID=3110539 RepID=UPI0028040867|nr:hypothetical protein [Paenibacillus silvisoli]
MGLINLPSMDDILKAKDTKTQMEMLVNTVGLLMKSLSELNGYISSKNVSEVGGWRVGQTRLESKDGDVGMSTEDTPGDDVRMWAGSSLPDIAPFRVLESGKVFTQDLEAVDASITGASIIGATITGGTINVTTDLNIGSNIYMSSGGVFDGKIQFGNPFCYIRGVGNVIDLVAFGGVFSNGSPVATTGSSTSSAGGHNHGIAPGTQLAINGGGFVTWVGASDHSHTI